MQCSLLSILQSPFKPFPLSFTKSRAMRLVVQKVSQGSVTSEVEGQPTSTASIDRGFVVLVGIEQSDTEADLTAMVKGLLKLRLFAPADADARDRGKSTLTLADAGAGLLLVSQFTLAAQLKSGRPTFHRAKKPDEARDMYNTFCQLCRDGLPQECQFGTGIFGSWMQVHVVNEGPFTICMTCKDGKCTAW